MPSVTATICFIRQQSRLETDLSSSCSDSMAIITLFLLLHSFLLTNSLHNFRGPPSLLYSDYRVSFPGAGGSSRRGVNLTNCLHLVLRLRMSGVILLLTPYAFMAWAGKNFAFSFSRWRQRGGTTNFWGGAILAPLPQRANRITI